MQDTTRSGSGRRPRTVLAILGLVALVALTVVGAPPSRAELLPPLPPLPPPPAEGNALADVLGPLTGTPCKTLATVYALAGPIASAQLPPDLQAVVAEVEPYASAITYACGFLVTPPSGFVCAADEELAAQAGALGIPLAVPPAVQTFYETAAGIENVFLRIGIDIGTDTSRQLAAALGCGAPRPIEQGPAASLDLPGPGEVPDAGLAVGSPGAGTDGFALPTVPAVVGPPAPGRTVVSPGTLGSAGSFRYPTDATAAALLLAPVILVGLGSVLGPRYVGRRRRANPRSWPTVGS